MGLSTSERKQRIRRRIRKVSNGTAERPRLSVFRSNNEIYAQVIDDTKGTTLVAVSSRDKDLAKEKGTKTEIANLVGKAIATKCKEAGIEKVAFDRGGNLYHGRVKSLAEGAREAGLNF
ncbi:50S ribosomal protein L18 [Zobellia galactanivorans]|uniref:Large ribosomal subunit protein uL18 n=2 Tax=Zobellia TaxID=112040 RepID=G0L628_ZOBGA|nr:MULTISPECIES: 50S ribosomal protein L18 [Zobellia]MBU3027701.1 50S ribosomal protein L18 [Zobellia galactanivorans]MDO6517607.1 50S ribosomal protein L18 [Zobellia uliginosa]MDO6807082.1 50S ribosomal protein L18 [Zobellia galactanivorans]OWW23984.1 50S ribosomal protein L18 [Zobellia sp. OII3]CAZ96676.1 Ribosomal protein L18 [Zobellia galactanivorans]